MANRDNRSRNMNPAAEPDSEASANDPIYTGEAYASDVRPEIARKTVGGSFEREQSVTARAYDNKNDGGAANDEQDLTDAAASDARYSPSRTGRQRDQQSDPELIEQAERATAVSESLRGRMRGGRVQGGASRAAAGLRATRAFFGWSILSIVGLAYLWQFLFATISLIGFGIHAHILEAQSTWWGELISVFVDFSKIVPADILGYAFFGLNFILVFIVFISLILWYYIVNGVSVLSTTLSTLITAGCLALSIMPVTNLFPWLVLWAIYMEVLKMKQALSPLFSTTP